MIPKEHGGPFLANGIFTGMSFGSQLTPTIAPQPEPVSPRSRADSPWFIEVELCHECAVMPAAAVAQDSTVTRLLSIGIKLRVVEVIVLGERVRGRLADGGWITLRGIGTMAGQAWARMTSCKPVRHPRSPRTRFLQSITRRVCRNIIRITMPCLCSGADSRAAAQAWRSVEGHLGNARL